MKKYYLLLFLISILVKTSYSQKYELPNILNLLATTMNISNESTKKNILEYAKQRNFFVENSGSKEYINDEYCYQQKFSRNTKEILENETIDINMMIKDCDDYNSLLYSVRNDNALFIGEVLFYLINNNFNPHKITNSNDYIYVSEDKKIRVKIDIQPTCLGNEKSFTTYNIMIYYYKKIYT